MPLPPYRTSEDELGESSGFAKGFVMLTAIGAWGLLFLILAVSAGGSRASAGGASAAVGLPFLFAFLLAGLLSFLGSATCLFAVSREFKKKNPWSRWCALGNYSALFLVFAVPWIGYWIDKVLR